MTDATQDRGPAEEVTFDASFAAYSKAEHFNDIGRHDLAETVLREALRGDPEDSSLHEQLARAYLGFERLEPAEREAKEALRLDADNVAAYFVLGAAHIGQGRHRDAEVAFLEGLRRDPENASGHVAYGHLMYKARHLDKAERLARQALRLDPENADAHQLIAWIRSERWDKSGARDHATAGMEIEPDHEDAHVAMGVALLRAGRPFAAKRHFREALRLDASDENEEMFLSADRCTRWIHLPYYWWSLLIERLPGQQFTVWIAVVGAAFVLPSFGVPSEPLAVLLLAYVAFVIYTWLANPLTSLWIKLRPPR